MDSEGLFRNRRRMVRACQDASMTNLPPGMYPPQQPLYAQQLLPGWENRTRGRNSGGGNGGGGGGDGGDGPFAEAFDFSFSTYASLQLVKIVYILIIVVVSLVYVANVIVMFVMTPILGTLVLILGWIPALFLVLAARIGLEVTLATVRTAIDARALRNHYVGGLPA
jgi:hypothetical protein